MKQDVDLGILIVLKIHVDISDRHARLLHSVGFPKFGVGVELRLTSCLTLLRLLLQFLLFVLLEILPLREWIMILVAGLRVRTRLSIEVVTHHCTLLVVAVPVSVQLNLFLLPVSPPFLDTFR